MRAVKHEIQLQSHNCLAARDRATARTGSETTPVVRGSDDDQVVQVGGQSSNDRRPEFGMDCKLREKK